MSRSRRYPVMSDPDSTLPAVTAQDVEHWLSTVPRHKPESPAHRAYYVKNWDVVGKIQRAKLAGHWPPVTSCRD